MNRFSKIAKILLIFLFVIYSPLYSESKDTTPEPYNEEEFPQGLKDLRRFEIITLGSMPFVTLDTTLVYSTIRYAQHDFADDYKPNIFSKSSFSSDEQKGIILTSLGISVGIGLTDYFVQLAKRSKKKKEKIVNYDDISITPIAEDPEAIKLSIPEDNVIEINDDEVIEVEE